MGNQKDPIMNWFVEPKDGHTNGIIASNLAVLNQVCESADLKDNHGDGHHVYQVENYSFITQLYKDKGKFILDFQVFYRAGFNGPIRLWTLGADKPRPRREVKIKPKGKNPKS
ncbi:MAG: hypothetical protein WCW61_01360 [Patescibacteria group bacterium]|jgi:hypothetical protein